jgi:ABC-type antimicrobial peptide transport system permease subunit
MEAQVEANAGSEKVVLQLSAAFALLATFLAMLGLYGVVNNSVTRRTREIGIRLALGAQKSRIGAMVFSEVGWIAALGTTAGIPLALALARYTESQLFGVQWLDTGVIIAAAFLAAGAVMLYAGLRSRQLRVLCCLRLIA